MKTFVQSAALYQLSVPGLSCVSSSVLGTQYYHKLCEGCLLHCVNPQDNQRMKSTVQCFYHVSGDLGTNATDVAD